MTRLHCAVAARCGGCPQIELACQAQRVNKEARVRAALDSASVHGVAIGWLYHDSAVGYRNRIRMRVVKGIPAFFNPHKSAGCAVLEPPLQRALDEVRHWASHHTEALEAVDHLEVRAPDLDGKPGLVLALQPRVSPAAGLSPLPLSQSVSLLPVAEAVAGPERFAVSIAGREAPAWQRFELLAGVYTYVPLGSFRQVNAEVNRLMLQTLRDLALELDCQTFSDLYCGSGNLSLPLLASGLQGSGVERDERAIAALQAAATEQGWDGSRFLAGDVTCLSDAALRVCRDRDLLVVDPPRAGLRADVELVVRLAPKHLVLCYCKVESFARDVVALTALGLVLERLWLCDMFPHTEHVEIMAWFRLR